jgi:hypothetical protein
MFEMTFFEKYSEDIEKELKQCWPRVMSHKLLWHNNYYDGPLNGILEIDGQMCEFFIVAEAKAKICPKTEECENLPDPEDDTKEPTCLMGDGEHDCYADWHKYYAIVPLSDKEYKELENQQMLFEKYVGNNNTYPARNNGISQMHPQEEWDNYYKKSAGFDDEKINFQNSYDRIAGWFKL